MNKLFTKIAALALGATMAVGVGVAVGTSGKVEQLNASADVGYTAATMTAGTNGSSCTVNGNNGIKVGTSKKGGDMTVTVPQGATDLRVYAAAWKGVSGLSLKITKASGAASATISESSIDLTADDGITNNSPFTLNGTESDFRFDFTLTNITSETTFMFETSSAKRFALWSAQTKSSEPTPTKISTTTEISASPNSIAINGEATLSATVSYSGGTVTDPDVEYTTNDTSIISISGSTITALAEGTATITGSYSGDNTYEASSGTTTITVTGAVYEGTFSLYSGEISEGDYVIYYNGKAMKNIVSSNRLSYNEITPSNNKIINPSLSVVWHIAPSGDYWTIYNDVVEKYAGSTNSKNQAELISSVTDNAKWTVTGDSTYEFENLARSTGSDSGNKWLRYNAGYGFACYASNTGDALSLYKAPVSVTGVSVSPTSKSLVVGEHQQLTATVSPDHATDKTVTWKSYSDSECTEESSAVASVSSTGLVTANSEGTAYIQVKTNDGDFTAVSTITVTGSAIAVTGVTVSPSSQSLTVNGEQQLTATVSPNNATDKTVTWKSYSDSSCTIESSAVASVSSTGLVTANSEGTAYIQVKTNDGGFTATCEVTVNPISVTGVTVSPTEVELAIGATQQLTPTVSPADATDQTVTWKSYSDSSCTIESSAVASVSSTGLVTAVSKGTAYIQVKTNDGGFTATCTITVLNLNSVTFVAGTDTGETSVTKNGVTITTSIMSRTDNYRVYAGDDMSVECTLGNIKSIELTGVSGNPASNLSLKGGEPGTYTTSGNNGTWTGDASSVIFTASPQARLTQIVVAFEQGETYTITYYANGGSDEMEPTTGLAPIVASNGFTPPEGKAFSKWNTSSDGKGDDYFPGEAVEQDLDLYAIWATPIGGDIVLNPTGNKIVTTTSVEKDAAKCGTGSAGGSTVLTVKKAGIAKIKVYVAAWNGDSTTISVSVSSGTISPASIEPTSDSGISGSATTYNLTQVESTFRFDFTLTNVPANAEITLSSSAGKQRFVVWGPTNLFAATFANTFLTELECDDSGVNQPSFKEGYSWSYFDNYYKELDEEEQGILYNASAVEHPSPSTDEEKIEASMARYDYIVGKYYYGQHLSAYNDFIDRKPSPIGGNSRIILETLLGENGNSIAVVVIVSVISLSAIGGYFFLRKRREQN